MIEKVLTGFKISSLNEMQRVAIAAAESRDTIILSPTGSGKTIAFLIPLLKRLEDSKQGVQSLVLAPSRELALQIEQVFKSMLSGFKVNSFYGGHSVRTEKNNLIQAPDVLIGTPGRVAYHIRHENFNLNTIHTLVLDEFDKALEFGFEEDMSFIISRLNKVDRRILTSATKMDAIPLFTGLVNPQEVNFLKDGNSLPNLRIKSLVSD